MSSATSSTAAGWYQVPTVATEPRVKFLRGFPSIGGYCAAAVPAWGSGSTAAAAGVYQAVLAADTLLPDGHGQALTEEEVSIQCRTVGQVQQQQMSVG